MMLLMWGKREELAGPTRPIKVHTANRLVQEQPHSVDSNNSIIQRWEPPLRTLANFTASTQSSRHLWWNNQLDPLNLEASTISSTVGKTQDIERQIQVIRFLQSSPSCPKASKMQGGSATCACFTREPSSVVTSWLSWDVSSCLRCSNSYTVLTHSITRMQTVC